MKVELEHVLQSVSCTQAARQRGASAHRLIDEPGRARLTRPERSNSGHSSATLSNQPALASEITHLLDTCEICGLEALQDNANESLGKHLESAIALIRKD